ncbi:pilus assembly protein CpaC [Yoonia tamlensis]|uniref:Pilus assembly protein CpaC n=1 Tax=Yoonia tamlensis TaxID=390270 RepID=A0A1I6FRN3_9RHOB|nr:type II and III secretion system protein family protein [Yoonia tamlensis]SFR32591.1 pilus assembly protein CpaC [Yoonia tamlensis]
MKYDRFIKAALTGLTLSLTAAAPTMAPAETLRVLRGAASSALNVPMNRAVVVESDVPYTNVSIANPGIADISSLSDRTLYVLGKEPGRTTLTLLGADGRLITNVEIHVTPDMGEFKERLAQILPGENIEVRTANDGIVLSGQVSSIARLERALELANRYAPDRVSNLMVVGGTQQVMLQVRFSEMNRSVRKSFGTNFTVGGSGGGLTTNAGTTPSAGGGNNGFATFGFGAGSMNVELTLEALETRGLVRTLAEPNLTALSGQEATFLAGGEYPIPVAQDENTITVEFKPFGVELNFIPTVIDDDIINIELHAAVSSVDTTNAFSGGGFTINAFSRRETSTTVEMRDGESFAIAGLLQDDFNDLSEQVPWIGDVPILGALFRSAAYEREQTELVIIVTPHLVSPTRGAALSLPTDRVQLPSEADLFLLGKTSAGTQIPGAAGEVARQDFSGSYGYVMDE